VIIVDGDTGTTKYYEYGRFDPDKPGVGIVQTKEVPNLLIRDGKIDGASLQSLVRQLNGEAGKGTPAFGTVLQLGDGGFDAALTFATSAEADPQSVLGDYSWANDNHCYSFAKEVAGAGGSWVDWFDGWWLNDNIPTEAAIRLLVTKGGFGIGPLGSEDFLLRQSDVISDTFDAAGHCFLPHTPILLADGTTRPIAAIRPGDTVLSPDKTGTPVPARVTRTFVNDVAHVLDFHGTGVTPGHAFLCGAGRFQGRHVPLLDILRDDGAVVRQDGRRLRNRLTTERACRPVRRQRLIAAYASVFGSKATGLRLASPVARCSKGFPR
jgi:hypothetical protein